LKRLHNNEMETTVLTQLRFAPCWAIGLAWVYPIATAATLTVGVLGLDDDARYQPRVLEHQYPGHPTGRPLAAAALAADESAPELEAMGHKLVVKNFSAASPADLPKVLAQLKAAKVQYVLLNLPEADIKTVMAGAPAAPGPVVFFNIGSAADELRGSGCNANLLHTYPSEAMRSDAVAQYLAARSWSQAMVLYGPRAQGNRRKVELIRALLHKPRFLLMDEATVGLDPASRHDLMRSLEALAREGQVAVLWTTHLVDEVVNADRLLVLNQGQIAFDGVPADLIAQSGKASQEQAFLCLCQPAPAAKS
jgi:ABC-type branched-subunit amino acid transport system substrate-binding protein